MDTKQAINYLDIIKKSFDANTAPRFSKDTIEQERARATEALNLAIKLLEAECAYCESGIAEIHNHEQEGECDSCANSYELSSRDNRCGDCGNCGTCCTHEGEGK